MEEEARRRAKAQVMEQMRLGRPWQEAVAKAGLSMSRTTAYRLLQRVRTLGESALVDGRHRHPSKVHMPVRKWLQAYLHEHPQAPCREAQEAVFD